MHYFVAFCDESDTMGPDFFSDECQTCEISKNTRGALCPMQKGGTAIGSVPRSLFGERFLSLPDRALSGNFADNSSEGLFRIRRNLAKDVDDAAEGDAFYEVDSRRKVPFGDHPGNGLHRLPAHGEGIPRCRRPHSEDDDEASPGSPSGRDLSLSELEVVSEIQGGRERPRKESLSGWSR